MRLTARRRISGPAVAAALVAVVVGPACGDAGRQGAAIAGRYVGTSVSFRVASGAVSDIVLAGIRCRIPHPDDEALSLCLERAPGYPSEEIALHGDRFAGWAGEVYLEGRFEGPSASGTWRFQTSCPDSSPCGSEGEWAAAWVAAPPADVGPRHDAPVTDLSPLDAGSDIDVGPLDVPGGDTHVLVPDGATAHQQQAAELLAEVRQRVVLAPVEQDGDIAAAAQAHADYYALHHAQYGSSGLSAHAEDPAWPEGFTGVDLGDRLQHQGVGIGGAGAAEVMAFSGSASGAMAGWMETLYHRVPLVHPNAARWGFGLAAGGVACEVADIVYGAAEAPGPAAWPPPGATDVRRAWQGWESPQPPLPDDEAYPSGPIITLTFATGTNPELSSATLRSGSGAVVPAQVQSPANDPWLSTTWAIYAYDPLDASTAYEVTFQGTVAGAPFERTWSLTTGAH